MFIDSLKKLMIQHLRCCVLVICALVFTVGGTPSYAAPSTWSVSYSGRITNSSGKPATGTIFLQVGFYGSATSTTLLGNGLIDVGELPLVNGVFQANIELSASEYSTILGDGSTPVYIEVRETRTGKIYPRQRFYAVPYAMKVPVDGTTVQFNAQRFPCFDFLARLHPALQRLVPAMFSVVSKYPRARLWSFAARQRQ